MAGSSDSSSSPGILTLVANVGYDTSDPINRGYTLTTQSFAMAHAITSRLTNDDGEEDDLAVNLTSIYALLLTSRTSPESSLGLLCQNDCSGSACYSQSFICDDSDLALPCLGTATGMFCSKSCESDVDCENPNTAMKCLTICPDNAMLEGKCWTESDHIFLENLVCPL